MCRVNSCCCDCSLRTGAIVCCVFTGIGSLLNFLAGGALLAFAKSAVQPANVSNHLWNTLILAIKGIGGFALFSGALSTLAFIFILLGITKRQAGFVMVWLVIDMIFIICNCIQAIALFVFVSGYVINAVGFLIGCAISIYLWIVVLSYYHDLREGGDGQQTTGSSKNVV